MYTIYFPEWNLGSQGMAFHLFQVFYCLNNVGFWNNAKYIQYVYTE